VAEGFRGNVVDGKEVQQIRLRRQARTWKTVSHAVSAPFVHIQSRRLHLRTPSANGTKSDMRPTFACFSKASRRPLTPKRGNKDYYKGARYRQQTISTRELMFDTIARCTQGRDKHFYQAGCARAHQENTSDVRRGSTDLLMSKCGILLHLPSRRFATRQCVAFFETFILRLFVAHLITALS
jgi:hypothetical protein